MRNDYRDIKDRISEEPLWWDENGVPRYGVFRPGKQADIYANELALLAIRCQGCGIGFDVCMSFPAIDFYKGRARRRPHIDTTTVHELNYGDPPNVGCCAGGASMNSVPKHVLKFWRKQNFEWVRVSELEIAIECGWLDDTDEQD